MQHNDRTSILDTLQTCYQEDPLTLRRIFLLLTRNHYAQPHYFGDVPASFSRFKYSDDPAERTVKVELDYAFNPETADIETAIYVGVGDVTSAAKVLNDFAAPTPDRSGRDYTNIDQCDVSLSHVAPSADESLTLGIISKGFFQGMQRAIVSKTGVQDCRVVALSGVKNIKPDQSDPLFLTQLVIRLLIPSTWTTSIESHRIKAVSFDVG